MSSQSVQLDSFLHTSKRFGATAKQGVDVLGTKKHVTLVAPAFPIKRQITSDGNVAFASDSVFKLPSSGYCEGLEVKSFLTQTTTQPYANYIGAVLPYEINLMADQETLHEYKYPPVFIYWLSKLKGEEARDKQLLAVGGTALGTAGTSYVMTPIPTFFDQIVAPGATPLNLSKFKKSPHLIYKCRTLAASVISGSTGGAITSQWLICYLSESSPALKNLHKARVSDFHKSINFYTNELNAVETATATSIDISACKGNIKRLMVMARLTSELDAEAYYVLHEVDSIRTRVDGAEDWVFQQAEEGEADFLRYNHGEGFNSTLGYPYIIPYGHSNTKQYATNHVGGMHSAKINKHEIEIVHSGGAQKKIDILAIQSAIFKYDDGNMIRLL